MTTRQSRTPRRAKVITIPKTVSKLKHFGVPLEKNHVLIYDEDGNILGAVECSKTKAK